MEYLESIIMFGIFSITAFSFIFVISFFLLGVRCFFNSSFTVDEILKASKTKGYIQTKNVRIFVKEEPNLNIET